MNCFYPKSGGREGENKDKKTHLNSLVTLWCIWNELYKTDPVSEIQSNKLANVMQSFYLERNKFYSFNVYVYMSNFTPCCLVHCLKNTPSEFFTFSWCVYLFTRTKTCTIFTGIMDSWNPRIPRPDVQFNQQAGILDLYIFCQSSL